MIMVIFSEVSKVVIEELKSGRNIFVLLCLV